MRETEADTDLGLQAAKLDQKSRCCSDLIIAAFDPYRNKSMRTSGAGRIPPYRPRRAPRGAPVPIPMSVVVENQEERFHSDEKLRLLARGDTPIVYRAIPFGPVEERRRRFLLDVQQLLIFATIPSLGLNLDFHLSSVEHREEPSEVKTFFESPMIFNGVCVKWIGHMGQSTLQGIGHFVFDAERAHTLEELRRDEARRFQTRIDAIYNRFQVSG
ncbi:hypothetical protein QR680_009365 [Steinernema hermaphroditum]|uniref:Uncharacterized protein n=1 Tax=Steinernema hermaphroditum TaxID=289476 RepID=A0AA39IM30_9BILA|nr:hypothetical protein QR680_009365 [Steinernema hermaphroditum]